MRCPHARLRIHEEAWASTEHVRDFDGTWTHESDMEDYTGMLNVKCLDCGLNKRYSAHKMPVWLQHYWNEMFDAPKED